MLTPAEKKILRALCTCLPLSLLSIAASVINQLALQDYLLPAKINIQGNVTSLVANTLRYDVNMDGTCNMNYLTAMTTDWQCFDTPNLRAEYARDCNFPDRLDNPVFLYTIPIIAGSFLTLLFTAFVLKMTFPTFVRAAQHDTESSASIRSFSALAFVLPAALCVLSFWINCLANLDSFSYWENMVPCSALADTLNSACKLLSPINSTNPLRFFSECKADSLINATYPLNNITGADLTVPYNSTRGITATPNPMALYFLFYALPILASVSSVTTVFLAVLCRGVKPQHQSIETGSINRDDHGDDEDTPLILTPSRKPGYYSIE